MDQKNMGTVECIKGGPTACSAHLGHSHECERYIANPRVNNATQEQARAAFESAMYATGGGGGPAPMHNGYGAQQAAMMMGGVGMPMPPQMGQVGAPMAGGNGYGGGYGGQVQQAAPQRVGVDVMGMPDSAAWGPPQNGHRQLGAGPAGAVAPPGVAIANFAGGAPATRTERLERASLAIYVKMLEGPASLAEAPGPHVLAQDAVRAARALLDEVDAVIQRS